MIRYEFAKMFATASGIALAFAVCAPRASAQSLDDSGNMVSQGDIIVTAQKRSQRLQDIPASISALTSAALEARRIDTVQDLATEIPNLLFTQSQGITVVAIRGVAPDTTSPAVDPSVAQHIDGVYQPRTTNMNLQLLDLESVEVLRGPQGTLYGRNATAGVINYTLKKPGDDFAAGASALLGNYNRKRLTGYVSMPLADGLAVRVSGLIDKRDGYGYNLFLNKDVDDDYTRGFRVALRLAPAGPFTLDVSAYHALSTSDGTYIYTFNRLTGPEIDRFPDLAALQTTEPRRVYTNDDAGMRIQQTGATAIIGLDLADKVKLRSISGFIDGSFKFTNDTEPSAAPISYQEADYSSKFLSQEFNLNMELFDRVNAVFGLYYMRERFDQNSAVFLPNGLTSAGSIPLTSVAILDQTSTSRAAFGDVTVKVTDKLNVIGGIRYTKDRKSGPQTQGFIGLRLNCNLLPVEVQYSSTTGKVGAQYSFNRNAMVYGQWQTGFKAGGFNTAQCDDTFLPENITSWEAGFKGSLFDQALNLNISLFDSKYSDLQVSQLVVVGGLPMSRIENAASATIRGLELESHLRVTDPLTLNLSLTYLDAKYKKYSSINAFVNPSLLIDLSGNRLSRAPKYTANAGFEYVADIGDYRLNIGSNVFISDKIFYTPFNEPAAAQDKSFAIVNANIGLAASGGRYKLNAFVKNLTKTDYITGAGTAPLFRNVRGTWNAPRTFGVELSGEF